LDKKEIIHIQVTTIIQNGEDRRNEYMTEKITIVTLSQQAVSQEKSEVPETQIVIPFVPDTNNYMGAAHAQTSIGGQKMQLAYGKMISRVQASKI
jgi:hypothetical protein